MRQADRVLVVGPQLHCVAQRSLKHFHDLPKVVRIDPGFDTGDPPPKPSVQPSMQVLVMGRLGDVKIKWLDIVARAVAEAIRLLGKDGENVRLVLCGVPAGEERKLRMSYETRVSLGSSSRILVSSVDQLAGPTASAGPAGSLESRTPTRALVNASSTQSPLPVL